MSITYVKHLLCIIAIIVSTHPGNAQCTSTGVRNATAAASTSFPGSDFSFSNATNIFSSDNSRASSSGLIALFNGQTEYLQATNFGFSVPPTAIICGITVEVEKSATGIGSVLGIGLSYVSDNSVRLLRNGSVAGNDKANATHWTTSETYHTYGGNSDIWGVAWTPTDINSNNFGVAFSANISGLAMLIPNVRLDHVRVTVHYYVALLPVTLLYFNAAAQQDHTTNIEWQTTTDNILPVVTVQRSLDGLQWEALSGTIIQTYVAGNYHYSMNDMQPPAGKSFYRLKIAGHHGETSYSAVKSVMIENNERVKIYPNPFTDRVVISSYDQKEKIALTDLTGRKIRVAVSTTGVLDLHSLTPGIYLLRVGNKIYKIQKQL